MTDELRKAIDGNQGSENKVKKKRKKRKKKKGNPTTECRSKEITMENSDVSNETNQESCTQTNEVIESKEQSEENTKSLKKGNDIHCTSNYKEQNKKELKSKGTNEGNSKLRGEPQDRTILCTPDNSNSTEVDARESIERKDVSDKSHSVNQKENSPIEQSDNVTVENSYNTNDDEGFDIENDMRRPKISLQCQKSTSHRDRRSFYEESKNFYYGNESVIGKMAFDTNILINGVDLGDEHIDSSKSTRSKREDFYKDIHDLDQLQKISDNGSLDHKECTIQIEATHFAAKEIVIHGRSKCGRAFTDDVVLVNILSDKSTSKTDEKKESSTPDNKIYGEVIGILERSRYKDIRNPVFVCVIDEHEGHLMKPLCKTIPKIHIKHAIIQQKYPNNKKHKIQLYNYDEDAKKLVFKQIRDLDPAERKNYIFLVVFIAWNPKCVYPLGAVIQVLLPNQDLETGLEIVGLQHQVPSIYRQETVDLVTELLEQMPVGDISLDLTAGREDLSDTLDVFTIDPSGARDLDDALSLEILNKSFRVGVHIADVASFVEKGSNIDTEAFERSFTYYPGQDFRPFRMLPEPLSDDLCSLIPGKKRLTLSVFFELSKSGNEIGSPVIKKTIVKSVRQLTYKEAWNIIADKDKSDKLSIDIKILHQLALTIRKKRLKDAMYALPVELDDEEDEESVLKTLEAHWLVEEYMIMTNHYIGNYLATKVSTIIRCQEPPSEEEMKTWMEMHPYIADIIFLLQNRLVSSERELKIENSPPARYSNYIALQSWVWCGIREALDNRNPIGAWNLLRTDEIHPEQALAYEEWIKFQETAKYTTSACIDTDGRSNRHFSLGMCNYTHFTSPIRRYPDLVVHRQLHAILDGIESVYSNEEIKEICSYVNPISKNVKAFGKQCKILQLAHSLKKIPRYINAIMFTDGEIVVYLPGMRKVPKRYRTIHLSLLDVSSKPILETDIDLLRPGELGNRERVMVKWQKRLYNYSGYHGNTRQQNEQCFKLDPHQRTTFMRYKDWVLMLKTVLNSDFRGLNEVYNSIKDDVNGGAFREYVNSCRSGAKDVSSEVNRGLITKHRCEFMLPIHINQIVGVQFSAEPKNGLLFPSPKFVDITSNFKCCLEHTDDPVKTFVEYSTVRTKQSYQSLKEYINIWLPIIKMESATNAVRNEDSVTINNIPIEFRGRQGKISNKRSFFNIRDIEFDAISIDILKKDENENETEKKKTNSFVSMGSSDYVCIRCCLPSTKKDKISPKIQGHPDSKIFWIGHGEFTKVKKTDTGRVDVIFSLHDRCCDPPKQQFTTTDNATIEIIQKAKVDKRTETYLKMLEAASPTSHAIALGRKLPKLDESHLKVAKDVPIVVPNLFRCNDEQLEAINRALTTRFSLIQGPPGWLKVKLDVYAPKMIRMYGKAFEIMEFPVPGKALASSRTMRRSKVDDYLSENDLVLHRLIRNEDKPFSDKLRHFDTKFRGPPENITLDDIKEYSKVLGEAKEQELKNVDVIFCTTSVAANPKFLKATKGRIYQCIIDECGMCTEPESMVPIIGTKAEQIVLIGDHKQLRPIVLCRAAVDLGLEKSLFERYACQGRYLTMLKKQYRMNPFICEFPSKAFYDGQLETVPSRIWQELSPLKFWTRLFMKMNDPVRGHIPHIFCHIEGEENVLTVSTEEGNEQSRSNMKEVEQVVRVFKYMMDVEKVDPNRINVISQYNAQCHALKEAFLKEGLINIKINTVIASQGGEWDYVIFSTVRSLPIFLIESNPTDGWCKKNLGFITDHHQINVALTRARRGLIIIGNQNLLRCDRIWRDLIEDYKSCDCLKNANNFPTNKRAAKPQKAPRFDKRKK
ncbi:LOW QUALITY PROTEIN: hypothetical protein KUTeg_019462 [Tegillarca granosa]|uniref:RNB domain-containing protein n=1 Tax=Tegillarca granosa TaxID=220873 RepID=A0ABQ9ECJ5_TEGGR|nr:LOW QUALITY PROTEIN: hypothetical protein KUTeg_019462 [Tegillarca granosa]